MLKSIKNIFSSPSSNNTSTSQCETITTSGSITKKCGNEKDYKEANYFNYFRVLEKTNSNIRSTVGLTSKNHSSLPIFKLTDFTIDSEMNNTSITSVWNQKYTNESSTPVEGKYQIPLPPYCVVSGFTIQYQDKVFIGKIKGKAKAQEKYSDAIASGGSAFLAEKSDNGLFNFQIGNLPPGETVTVSLTIVSEVGNHLSSLHFCLHRFLFPVGSFNFNFNLNVNLTNSIKNIELFKYGNSNTEIVYAKDGSGNGKKNQCKISFSKTTGVSEDVVVIIEPENESDEKPQQLIEFNQKHNSYAVSLNFLPSFNHISSEDINQKGEFIFVIDCSGSMSGEPIKKAKNALEIIIRSLNENCKFNIYCFGSSWTRAFSKGSQMYNDESLEKVSKYVAKIDADLGGTELLGVMKEILTAEPDFEFPRQVFILTDGEISDRDGMIKFAATHSMDTRIFTYGIGSGVDKELVIGLSKACKGYYEFIKDNSGMEEQVMKLVSIAFEPTLSNIKIDWGSLSVEQGPSRIRPVYSNETLVVYGLVNTPNEQLLQTKATIQLIGNGPTGLPISFPVELDFTNQQAIDTKNSSIHTLAAFKVIQDLEEAERKGNHKNNQDKIEELGKKYGLVSKYTSYIVTAVSNTPLVTEETMQTIDIVKPTTVTSNSLSDHSDGSDASSDCDEEEEEEEEEDYHEEEQEERKEQQVRSRNVVQSAQCKISQQDDCMMVCDSIDELCSAGESLESMDCDKKSYSFKKKSKPQSSVFSFLGNSSSSSSSSSSKKKLSMKKECEEEDEVVTPKASTDTGLMQLIKSQKANGSWSVSQFPSISVSKKPANIDNVDIWITLHIINKITKEYSSQQTQYALVIQKAIKWVKQQLTRLNISNEYDNLLQLSY